MATNVATTFSSFADGESFSSAAMRLGLASHSTVTNDYTDALKSRSGIIPGFGTPLDVTQTATPGMKVTVKKGSVVQQSSNATGGVYAHSLTADTDLDIATANATNPRWDLVVATVFDDGTSASFSRIEVLTGTAASSPALPTSYTSPAANTHYFPLARVLVAANATSILNASITKPTAGSYVSGQFTAAPGGTVRGINRQWTGTRSTNDSIATGATGASVTVSVPSAEAVPGIYRVCASAGFRVYGGSGTTDWNVDLATPGRTVVRFFRTAVNTYQWVDASDDYVLQTGPGTALNFALNFRNLTGTNSIEAGFTGNPGTIVVTRVADL